MTAAEQLGSQLKVAREQAKMSARALSRIVGVSAPTIGDYESGQRIPPADKLAKIAEAVGIHSVEVDGYRLTVTREEVLKPSVLGEQLALDFTGEYAFSRATVRLSPGRINISFDGATPIINQRVS